MRWKVSAVLVCTASAFALTAHGRPVRPELAQDRVPEPLRAALAQHLTAAELTRLLSRPDVASSLSALVEGWDGVADELTVTRADGRLVLRTLIRERRCFTALELNEEAPTPEPSCVDHLRPDGDRRLSLDERLWEPAPRPRPPPSPRPPQVADVRPEPEPGPAENTVLRVTPRELPEGPVHEARVAHEALKDKLRRPHWHDPLLPKDALEAGAAFTPLELPPPAPEARADAELRNPFSAGRLRTDLPVPDMLTLPNDPAGMPTVPGRREECDEAWRLRERTDIPPSLDCYRRFAWNERLDRDEAYKVLSTLASFLDVPLLRSILDLIERDAASHRAHQLVWAFVWLDWVQRNPAETGPALARLTTEERRFLRRRLADLWVEQKLAAVRPTITHLFERHLLDLYPEARDPDGLPRRAFVTDTWLWANNWLAILDGRPDEAIAQAYHRLAEGERRVIDAFVRDRDLSSRWTRVHLVLAAL